MLNTDYSAHANWFSFFIMSIIVLLLWLIVKLLFNFFLRSFSHTHKIVSVNYLILADRSFRILLTGILIISFILVNPKVHGSLIAVFLLLCYPLLKDLFIGLSIIPKINLLRENYIKSGDHQGAIKKLRWLGVILDKNGNEKYLPYSYLYTHGFLQRGNNYNCQLKFTCTDSFSRSTLQDVITKKLFMLPFIAKGSKPEIHFKDHIIILELDITNRKFEESIINAIEELRIENTTIKAI